MVGKYHKNCSLSEYEWNLEKIVDEIKAEPSTLFAIGILREEFEKMTTLCQFIWIRMVLGKEMVKFLNR